MSVSAVALRALAPGQILVHLEEELGLTPRELAAALDVDQRTVERWRAGTHFPQRNRRQQLDRLLSLLDCLQENFDSPEAIREWLRESSLYLGGLSPAEALRLGRPDLVEGALKVVNWGIFFVESRPPIRA